MTELKVISTKTEIRKMEQKVTLVCSAKGCPRTRKVSFDSGTMPANTAKIESKCPWHASAGDFETEIYFDASGNQLWFKN